MSAAESAAFAGFLRPATRLLEFGCGGSTLLAARATAGRVVSVDSSAEWIGRLRQALAEAAGVTADMVLVHADIGQVGEAGYPQDRARRADWPRYHAEIWNSEAADSFDLFFVDGRFRVACALQCLLRGRDDAVVLMHDYAPRREYHAVALVGREIFRAESLSAFVRPARFDRDRAMALLEAHRDLPG